MSSPDYGADRGPFSIERQLTRREVAAVALRYLWKQWPFRLMLASPLLLVARITGGTYAPKEAAIAASGIILVLAIEFIGEYIRCSRLNGPRRPPAGS